MVFCGIIELRYSPWREALSILDLEYGSRVESVVKEAVKSTETAGGIVEEVMGERHLVEDVVVKW